VRAAGTRDTFRAHDPIDKSGDGHRLRVSEAATFQNDERREMRERVIRALNT
jgi:hypothetical protein